MNVCAIVVTYNPNIDVLTRLIESLSPQVTHIVIVDNGSLNKESISTLTSAVIRFHPLESNFGIAHAHNQGITQARKLDAQAVLLMDQDSVPAHDMVQNLTRSMNTLVDRGELVSAVGACYFGADEENESFFVRFGWLRFKRQYCSECDLGKTLVPADFLISSGSLILLSAIDRVGEMDERLFIDHVDTDWFLRAAHVGYQAYGDCRALMEHGLGERTLKIWVLRMRHVPQHRPFR
ncbi:MAG: glycosyltransferase family 2 protein, partial [Proteobacteria bacterium]|nr:glycosyltransferase family 2 protein [Pseudomonadota bacterium]